MTTADNTAAYQDIATGNRNAPPAPDGAAQVSALPPDPKSPSASHE